MKIQPKTPRGLRKLQLKTLQLPKSTIEHIHFCPCQTIKQKDHKTTNISDILATYRSCNKKQQKKSLKKKRQIGSMQQNQNQSINYDSLLLDIEIPDIIQEKDDQTLIIDQCQNHKFDNQQNNYRQIIYYRPPIVNPQRITFHNYPPIPNISNLKKTKQLSFDKDKLKVKFAQIKETQISDKCQQNISQISELMSKSQKVQSVFEIVELEQQEIQKATNSQRIKIDSSQKLNQYDKNKQKSQTEFIHSQNHINIFTQQIKHNNQPTSLFDIFKIKQLKLQQVVKGLTLNNKNGGKIEECNQNKALDSFIIRKVESINTSKHNEQPQQISIVEQTLKSYNSKEGRINGVCSLRNIRKRQTKIIRGQSIKQLLIEYEDQNKQPTNVFS